MSQVAVYDFRYNLDSTTKDGLIAILKGIAKKWAFQKEKGDSGYVHWQGRMSLIKARRKPELMSLMRMHDIPIPQYLEPSSAESLKGDCFYVMKLDTRVEGPWTDKDKEEWTCPEWDMPEFWHPWQQQVIDSRQIRDKRTINLVLDRKGNHGKTHLTMYLEQRDMCVVVPSLHDAKEIMECICDELMATENRDPKLVIVDLPRAVNKKALAGLMTALEQIKNGKVIDRRYHYKKWFFRPPQLWVFTNRLPNLAYMSMDRWQLWELTDSMTLTPYQGDTYQEDMDIDDEAYLNRAF